MNEFNLYIFAVFRKVIVKCLSRVEKESQRDSVLYLSLLVYVEDTGISSFPATNRINGVVNHLDICIKEMFKFFKAIDHNPPVSVNRNANQLHLSPGHHRIRGEAANRACGCCRLAISTSCTSFEGRNC